MTLDLSQVEREALEELVAAFEEQRPPTQDRRHAAMAAARAALAAREEPPRTLDAAVEALDRTVPERAQKAVERLNAAREDTERPDGDWPKGTTRPAFAEMVQVLMTEDMARRFEAACLGEHTRGHTELVGPLLFSADDLPTYTIGVRDTEQEHEGK